MPTKIIKNAWNKGQFSQYMDGRTDLSGYYNAASKLINALVLPHGGFVKRPGTIFKAISATRANLTPFEFSVGDALILEWSNLLLRFYKDQAQVFEPFGTEDLSSIGSIVAHWKCDDNAGTTVVIDADGATYNGVASANTNTITTTDAEDTANEAFDLGGTDYITVTNNPAFSFGDGSDDSAFSVTAWVYFLTHTATQTIIAKSDPSDNAEWVLDVTLVGAGHNVRFALYDEAAGTPPAEAIETDEGLTSGNWYFIVATYDGRGGSNAADGMNIYIDRAKYSVTKSHVAGYVAMEPLAADVTIGAHNISGFKWQGKIDNVAIFNKELSAVEIASLTGNDSTTPYSITSPYTTARAFGIHYTQSADVMYIAHNDVHPKKLSRLGDASWTIIDVPFTGGPLLPENTIDTHLVGFARTGGTTRNEYYFPTGAIGTLTATAHSPFNSNQIGALWLIKHTRDNDNDTDTFAKDTNVVPTLTTFASGAIFIKGDATVSFEPIATSKMAQLWRKTSNGKWQTYRSFRGATAFSWTEDEDDILYAMTRSDNTINGTLTAKEAINYGIVKITAFTSSTVVTVEVIDKVLSDNSTDNAITTSMWAEGAWSTYRGFPRTVGFHEDRLWWASSTNDPDRKWSSQSGLYENMAFTIGTDNEAVTAIVKDNEVSQIQWMMSRRVMAIGAANREYSFSAQNPEDPITPLDKKSTPQTGFSSGSIQPVMLNDSIFFLQRQGKKLGAMKFDSVTENFVVDDATLLAYGLLDSTPTNMAVSRSPDSLIWVVRTDGVLPTFTYEPKEEVSGWGRQIFGNSAAVETPTGYVESVAVIHGTSEDEIWVNVRRVIDTSTVYYTELFSPRDWGSDIEDAIFGIDSCGTYDGAEVEFIDTGADHLVGETVSIFADGVVFDDAVVNANGYFDLKKATVITGASVVHWGLPYTMKVRSMRLAVPQTPHALQAKIKRVTSVTIRYIRSLLGSAGTEISGTEFLTDIVAT
ncbi:hypothetical protein LCGC14_1336100, partial [marine sediment metagenome]